MCVGRGLAVAYWEWVALSHLSNSHTSICFKFSSPTPVFRTVVFANPVTKVSNGSGAVQIWYSREFGLLPPTHQWHVPTTVLWWVTGARWVSGATCCSRFHPPGACDFDTNGWWVSGATIFPSEETLKFHFLGPGGSFFQPFRLFKIYRVH